MNRQTRPRLTIRKCAKRTHMSIFSKSVVQILLWQILTIAMYVTALEELPGVIKLPHLQDWSQIMRSLLIKVLFLVYPLSTIVGDVCLGRYKTIVISLLIISVSMLSSSIGGVLLFVKDGVANKLPLKTASTVLHILSAPTFIIGFFIYNSTIIQFGLDQLIYSPSESLGVFTHWFVWANLVGTVLIEIIYTIRNCASKGVTQVFLIIIQSLPICFLALLLILLLLSWCTRQQLNHDGVLYNPYKMIYNVFRFARKNKYPLNPVSAFNDTQLSRLDNAKERYGGPFRNTEVEDVKYFKRVLIVLCALGPVFVLFVPMNELFSHFTKHTGLSIHIDSLNITCDRLNPEFFSNIFGVFVLPLYIWIMYSFLPNRRPKILHRLVLLVLLYILAGVSMLVIDTAGHLSMYTHQENQPMCMFLSNDTNGTTLQMHWAVNIFPGVINGVYYLLYATSLEFIAAQSPHAMRGILMGAFYFIMGIFLILSILLLIPFKVTSIWGEGDLSNNPPVISCGFGYYAVCIGIAVVGFVALLLAVKWYQYRRRDEPFTPQQTNTPRRQDYQQLN